MRETIRWPVAVLLSAFVGILHAEPYGGGSANWSQYGSGGVDGGVGYKFFAGYMPYWVPMAFELGYVDSGDLDFEQFPGDSFSFRGVRGVLAFSGLTDPVKRSRVWIGGGGYSGETEIISGGTVANDHSGGLLSVGTDLMINRNFGLRLEIENYFNLGDSNLAMFSAGLTFRVGAENYPNTYPERPYPQVMVPPPGPAPVGVRPLPPAPTAPPFTALPQSTWMPGAMPGGPAPRMAAVRVATRLLMSRNASGGVVADLPVGTQVVVKHFSQNAEGRWWYVESNGKLGWVNALALDAPR